VKLYARHGGGGDRATFHPESDGRGYIHRSEEEWYDLTNDPNELKKIVAGDSKEAAALDDLRKRVKTWQRRTNDRGW
jgi:hypothetical protein